MVNLTFDLLTYHHTPKPIIWTGLINTKCLTTKVVWIGWVLQFVKMRMGGMIGVLW